MRRFCAGVGRVSPAHSFRTRTSSVRRSSQGRVGAARRLPVRNSATASSSVLIDGTPLALVPDGGSGRGLFGEEGQGSSPASWSPGLPRESYSTDVLVCQEVNHRNLGDSFPILFLARIATTI